MFIFSLIQQIQKCSSSFWTLVAFFVMLAVTFNDCAKPF